MRTLGALAALLIALLVVLNAVGGGSDGRGEELARGSSERRLSPVDDGQTKSPAQATDGRSTDAEAAMTADVSPAGRSRVTPAPTTSGTRGALPRGRAATRTILGTVVDEDGPVRGAHVLLLSAGETIGDASSSKTGQFELTFPVPADDVVLAVHGRGRATLERELGPQRIVGQQHLGNLFLRQGMFLSGIVVDDANAPIGGATVQLTSLDGRSSPGLGETTHTGIDGRFEFPTAPPGTVTLIARAEHYGETTVRYRNIPGREARLSMAPGADLVVRVVDMSDRPVVGVPVTVRGTQPTTAPRNGKTDAEGRVTFAGLTKNQWTVRTTAAGYKPGGLRNLVAGSDEALLRLVPWPSATGRVVTPAGEAPPVDTRVHAIPAAARGDLVVRLVGGTPVGADGRFRIGDLRPGKYRIHAVSPGFADSVSEPFVVGDVGEARVGDVRLLLGGSVRLEVRIGADPIAGISAEVLRTAPVAAQQWTDPRGGTDALETSDAKGSIVLESLSVGSVWVTLRGERTVPKTIGPLRVSSGETTEPRPITLSRGLRIEGRARTEGGTIIPRARIRITGNFGSVPFLQSDANGAFRSPCLPPGTYTVEATSVQAGKLFEADPIDIRLTEKTGDARAELTLLEETR